MEPAAMDRIAARLSAVDGLYYPTVFLSTSPAPPARKSALLDLLSRDAPLFLERYGAALRPDELAPFDALRDDYEVGWHLRRLRAAAAGEAPAPARVRNRRRAYLHRLVTQGDYFSEEAMREREPYLHHEYLGRFQDPFGRAMVRPGEKFSETLMRRAEEAVIVEKIRGEQIRRGVDPSEWVGGPVERPTMAQEEEEEEEEEEGEEEEDEENIGMEENTANLSSAEVVAHDEAGGCPNETAGPPAATFKSILTPEEMEDQLEQFTSVMQEKFLSGQDSEHMDYPQIDNDEMLDDHWSREANYDAEDKYFNED